MTMIVRGVVLLAAILFIAVSASMNAVFLSSFGRTAVETTLLTGLSVSGDAIRRVARRSHPGADGVYASPESMSGLQQPLPPRKARSW